jgi:hypothetical protein
LDVENRWEGFFAEHFKRLNIALPLSELLVKKKAAKLENLNSPHTAKALGDHLMHRYIRNFLGRQVMAVCLSWIHT